MRFKLVRALTVFVVIAAIIFNAVAISASNSSETENCEAELLLLKRLQIIESEAENEKGELALDKTVTRREAAKLIVKFVGMWKDGGIVFDSTPFIDVAPDDPENGYIKICYDLGIIDGYSDWIYNPDMPIKNSEFVKILVRAMGYKNRAESVGGYPHGYFMTAYGIGIKSVESGTEDDISIGKIIKMMGQALVCDIGNDLGIYNVYNEKTLVGNVTALEKYHNTIKTSGVVTGTYYTRLSDPEPLSEKNQIEINDEIYETEFEYPDSLLGYSVYCYVSNERSDSDYEKIVHIEERSTNSTLYIEGEDILSISSREFEYVNENDKEKTVSIQPSCDIIYNKRALTDGSINSDKLKPVNGDVVLLDRDDDRVYDVMFVTSYEDYVVGSLNETEYKIYDKYKTGEEGVLELDPEENDVVIMDNKDNVISFGDIAEWNVLSVAKSEEYDERAIITVRVSMSIASGSVSTIRQRDGKYGIGTKEYKVSPDYTKPIYVGDKGTFYINYKGMIAGFDASESEYGNYAYLVGASKKGISDTVTVKIYTTYDDFEKYELAENVIIDGSKSESDNSVNVLTPQLIKYKVNDEDKIWYIDTKNPGKNENSKCLTQVSSRTDTSVNMKYETYLMNGIYKLTKKTVIFSVPSDAGDTDAYGVASIDNLSSGQSYSFDGYDTNEVNELGAMVLVDFAPIKEIQATETASIILTNIENTMINEEIVCCIEGITRSNQKMSLTLKDETLKNGYNLQVGDIVRFAYDMNQNITDIEKVYNVDGKAGDSALIAPNDGVYYSSSDFSSGCQMLYGNVVERVGNTILFDSNGYIQVFDLQNIKFVKCNQKTGESTECTVDDIGKNSEMFIHSRYGLIMLGVLMEGAE